MFIKLGIGMIVNMDDVQMVSGLSGEPGSELTIVLKSNSTAIRVKDKIADDVREALGHGPNHGYELMDEFECDCPRCDDLRDDLIAALRELESPSQLVQ